MPDAWQSALERWSAMNQAKKGKAANQPAPDRNDEYLFYQTLLGAWPPEPPTAETFPTFRERILHYMEKATREGKVHTSWINPNAEYDTALREFITRVLPDNPDDPFVQDVARFQQKLAFFGCLNSLSQTLLKLTCPGVPDFYQGTELWNFSLVDPDNRRPVDYARWREVLTALKAHIAELGDDLTPLAGELLANLPDGRIKLFLIFRILTFRREHRDLFTEGMYQPLRAEGPGAEHVCAFLRQRAGEEVLIVAPLLLYRLLGGEERLPLGGEIWADTHFVLPESAAGRSYRHLLTGAVLQPDEGRRLYLGSILQHFPVACFERI
jgi:(1->4)-alpha-D-glucan 1-alpha-D-glucosylmutase